MTTKMHRRDFLKGAAAVSGAALLAGCGGGGAADTGPGTAAPVTHPPIDQESGTLSIGEWPGYEAGGTKVQTYGLTAGSDYVKTYGASSLVYTDIGNDDKVLNKVRAGTQYDLIHPCVGYVHDWANSGTVQPFDPAELSNLANLYPKMVTAGQVDGKQYWVPWDWGYSSILYRTDKVDPADATGWELFWNAKYKGHISLWDGGSAPGVIAGLVLGVDDIWNQTPEELAASKAKLIEQKPLNKYYWTDYYGQLWPDFESGDIWITYAWPDMYATMKEKLDVEYMDPSQGQLAWVCGFVMGKDTQNWHHCHQYVNDFISKQNCINLTNTFYYGSADSTVVADDIDNQDLAAKLRIGDPAALDPPVHIDSYIANRAEYQAMWEEVKAS